MTHRGEIVGRVLDELGIKRTQLAEKLGVHRDTIRNWVLQADLEFEKIRRIGLHIGYDFSQDFPDYPYTAKPLSEIGGKKEPEFLTIDECVVDRDHWREKYYTLLERHSELQDLLLRRGK